MQVYKASRKTEKDGKTYWNPVGFTVFVSEYQGEPRISLIDERTGESYPCFPPRPREDQAPAATGGVPF